MISSTIVKDWKNCTNITSLEVPEKLKISIKTDMQFIDHAFGGNGITPSVCTLFTGTPGAGKTTLMQQLADSVTKSGNIALFNTTEESLYQIARTTERLGLKDGFIAGQDSNVSDVLLHAKEVQKANPDKQLFLFFDSLQTLDDGKYASGYTNTMTAVRVLTEIIRFCKENYAISFVIGQVNKSGEFQGKQTLKHIVDAHCHLSIDTDKHSQTYGERIFEVNKNRYGCSGIAYALSMTQRGLIEAGSGMV